MRGRRRTIPRSLAILAVVWLGAVVSIALRLVRIDSLGFIGGAFYIVLGWTAIVALPELLTQVETLPLLLIVVGGLLYTTGAVILLGMPACSGPTVML
jgi:hemolysin III